jgi:hypothetical protein
VQVNFIFGIGKTNEWSYLVWDDVESKITERNTKWNNLTRYEDKDKKRQIRLKP